MTGRRPGQPETRTETFEGMVGDHYVEGWQVVHDGPCVFVDGECSCGRLDLGVVR